MRKLLISVLILILSYQISNALTFPISEDYRLKVGESVVLTGWYWQQRSYGWHKALDIPAYLKTPVMAVKSGVVIKIDYGYRAYTNTPQYGNYIDIVDEDGYTWRYAHLHKYYVQDLDKVKEGQVIAEVGSTGMGYLAPHLHLEKISSQNQRVIFTKDFGLRFHLKGYKK